MAKFQIVTAGATKSDRFDTFQPIECFAARGYRHTGYATRTCLRPELSGQPTFEGLCGPLWGGTEPDGTPVIRYEDWASYDILSR